MWQTLRFMTDNSIKNVADVKRAKNREWKLKKKNCEFSVTDIETSNFVYQETESMMNRAARSRKIRVQMTRKKIDNSRWRPTPTSEQHPSLLSWELSRPNHPCTTTLPNGEGFHGHPVRKLPFIYVYLQTSAAVMWCFLQTAASTGLTSGKISICLELGMAASTRTDS